MFYFISNSLPQLPNIVITDGSRPIKWNFDNISGEINTLIPPLVVDTTGAGDSFTAGLIYQLLKDPSHSLNNEKCREIVLFAAACGALVCGGSGGIDPQPSYDTVAKFLSRF